MTSSQFFDPFNVQYWKDRWTQNKIGFHKPCVNETLLKYIDLLTGQNLNSTPVTDPVIFQANSQKTWFVPLCGKTLDIPYLLSQGFRVFGVEAVKQAIEELECEQKLDLKFDTETSLFTGVNGRLQIYVGDFFEFPAKKYGPFDYVWDRGSFIAIEYEHRQKYLEVMHRALKRNDGSWYNFRYLLETVRYDKEKFPGPPRTVSSEEINTYFGLWANTKLVSEHPPPENSVLFRELQGQIKMRQYLITPNHNSEIN